ncbi:uncharacterized protein LOC119455750 [Dermacentor silvarum]|uniref:uncharacterized protein LOC119455750 n=1 Tax=Dermacentor silvarum TaxID=543639 RepID=UPI00189765F7|nr:uncharacterized protein LOC119455750 [Dermacentor silvarum]
MLAMYVDVAHKTWDEILPYVTFAYNTAPQETTQMTPFELVFGRQVATMLDAVLPHVEDNIHADVAGFLQRAEEARQLARMRIKEKQNIDARLYNLRRRDQEYALVQGGSAKGICWNVGKSSPVFDLAVKALQPKDPPLDSW